MMHIQLVPQVPTAVALYGIVALLVCFVFWLGFCLVVALLRPDKAQSIITAAGCSFPMLRRRSVSQQLRCRVAGPGVLVAGVDPEGGQGSVARLPSDVL